MNEILQSPFSLGFCLLALFAWVMTLCALIWPQDVRPRGEDDPDVRF